MHLLDLLVWIALLGILRYFYLAKLAGETQENQIIYFILSCVVGTIYAVVFFWEPYNIVEMLGWMQKNVVW